MDFENKESVIKYCVEHNILNAAELAKEVSFSRSWVYAKLKELDINYKEEITIHIMLKRIKEDSHNKWIKSCGEHWDEVANDHWVWYGARRYMQVGESGWRREVIKKEYKGLPYNEYKLVPDEVFDDEFKEPKCDKDYKYVFICPERTERWHSDYLKSTAEKLGIPHQAAKDCARGKTKETYAGWIVKKTADYYA